MQSLLSTAPRRIGIDVPGATASVSGFAKKVAVIAFTDAVGKITLPFATVGNMGGVGPTAGSFTHLLPAAAAIFECSKARMRSGVVPLQKGEKV